MPHRNLEERRATWRRWAEKNLHKPEVYMKRKARNKAYCNIPNSPCSIENCLQKAERHHQDYNKPVER